MMLFRKELTPYYPLFIAEISCNHNGTILNAKKLIRTAKSIGADAVKIQVYEPSDLANRLDKDKLIGGDWDGYSLYELYKETYTPKTWIHELVEEAYRVDIPIFPSVFNHKKINTLHKLYNFPAYKVSSYEYGYSELITACTNTGSPTIVSYPTYLLEIPYTYNDGVIPLVCSNNYNGKFDHHAITHYVHCKSLREVWGVSEHSTDCLNTYVACASGAQIVEKHLRLHKSKTHDMFSLTPNQFSSMMTHSCRVASINKGTDIMEGLNSCILGRRVNSKRTILYYKGS